MIKKGFTLVELMIALSIISLVSISAMQMLDQIVIARDRNKAVMEAEWELFLLKNQITEDIDNIVNRSIRDQLGAREAAMILNLRDIELLFTRGGMPIFALKQTSLMRVAYDLEEGTLFRYYWRNLDRTEGEEPVKQEVAKNIKRFVVEVYSKSYGGYKSNWKSTIKEPLPSAIRITLESPLEEIIFSVPILQYEK